MNVPIWKNRSVLLALVGVLQSVILQYTGVSQELWIAIDALLIAVIGAWAVEEGATRIVAGLREFGTLMLKSKK